MPTKRGSLRSLLALPCVGFAALVAAPACANALTAIDGSVNVYCAVHTGGVETACVVTSNVPTSEEGTAENECTGNGGALAASCPASGVIGCCSQTQSSLG